MTEHHRHYGAGQGCGGIAAAIHSVDGGTAVLAVQLRIQVVIGILSVELHTLHQEAVPIIGGEVQTLGLLRASIEYIIVGCIVANPQAGTQSFQQGILRCCHVHNVRIVLDSIVIFVVVRPAGQNHQAAFGIEFHNGINFCLRVCSGVFLSRRQTTGRYGQDDGLVLLVAAGVNQLLAGVEDNRAHAVFRRQLTEVAHGILVVTVYILIIVGSVDAHINQLIRILDVQLDVLGEGELLSIQGYNGGNGNLGNLGGFGSPLEVHSQLAGSRNGITGLVHAQNGAAYGVGNGRNRSFGGLTVEQLGGEGQLLTGHGGGGAGSNLGDAQLQALAYPHRGGNSQIAVALGHSYVVVGEGGVQSHGQVAGSQLSGVVPGIGNLAGVDNDFYLGNAVGSVRVIHQNVDVQLLGNFFDDGAQLQAVYRVVNLQVLVLGGVDTIVADCLVQTFLGEVVGKDNVTGIVGIAPLALVVILVVGRCYMPALIQSHGVVLIAGIVAAGTNLAFAVANLNQLDTGIHQGIPVGEVCKGAEGAAGMVELADGICQSGVAQQVIVSLQACIVGLVVQNSVVSGNNTGGIEGIDVTGAAGPGHFKAADGNHIRLALVEGGDSALIGVPQLLTVGSHEGYVVQSSLGVGVAALIKVVGVVSKGHKVHIGAVLQILHILQCGLQGAGAVGIGGVGVELTEVQLELGLAHGEAPGLLGSLAVCPGYLHGDGYPAVCHVGSGGVGNLAVFINSLDILTVHSHGNGGVLAGIHNLRRDGGPLVIQGFAAGSRGHLGDHRLVQNLYLHLAGEGGILVIGTGYGNGHLSGHHILGRDGKGVGGVLIGEGGLLAAIGCLNGLDAKGSIHGEGYGVFHANHCILHGAEGHGGVVHHAADHIHALCHFQEGEGVNVIVGDIIHAVGLIVTSIVLQELAVLAVELGGTALQGIAGALNSQGPVCIVRSLGSVESIVAGAVGAQVAKGFVMEAIVLPILFHGEYHAAVARHRQSVFNGGGGVQDGLRVALQRQDALCAVVVENNLIARLRHAGFFTRIFLGNLNKLHGINAFVACRIFIGRELREVLIPFHIQICTVGIDDIVAAFRSRRLHLPGVVYLIQRQAVSIRIDGKLIAAIAENIVAFCIYCNIPYQIAGCFSGGRIKIFTCTVIGRHSLSRQSLAGARIVNHHPVAICNRALNGAAQLQLGERGIPQLQCAIVDAHCTRDRHHIAHSNGPAAVIILGYHSLVKLNGITGIILEGDVGIAVVTVVVINLSHRQVLDRDIGADILSGQSTDGGGLGLQSHAGGFLIGRTIKLRKSLEGGPCSGGNDGVAQGEIGRSTGHIGTDSAGFILQVDILSIQKGHNALDSQISGSLCRCQSLGDGNGFGLIGRCYLAAFSVIHLENKQIENIAACIGCGVCPEPSIFILPTNRSVGCTGRHKAECPVSIVLNYPSICFIRLCKVCSRGTIS